MRRLGESGSPSSGRWSSLSSGVCEKAPYSLYRGPGGGVEYVVVVGVIDLEEGAVRDGLLHPAGVSRREDKALFGSGESDGREQHQRRAPDAGPQLREREAVHLLPVVRNGLEIGVVAPPALAGSDVA